jgi:tRNA threonylcarbamoyladenosine biosynthesis protein TsaB
MALVLAFDTATHVATVAVLRGADDVLGERTTRPHRALAAAAELLAGCGAGPADVERLVVGTGPGSFTGLRLGLAMARGFALADGVPAAGVSTLDALAAGAPGASPVIDGGRREVFSLVDGVPASLRADQIAFEQGARLVGDGAVRYRKALEAAGADVPPDDSELHLPRASLHAAIALGADVFGAADLIEPIYVRAPDAKVPA